MALKYRDKITQEIGLVYSFRCDQVACKEEHKAELARTFGERFKEHLRVSFTIYDHGDNSECCISVDSFSIVERGM